jgi:hypothetical protein
LLNIIRQHHPLIIYIKGINGSYNSGGREGAHDHLLIKITEKIYVIMVNGSNLYNNNRNIAAITGISQAYIFLKNSNSL